MSWEGLSSREGYFCIASLIAAGKPLPPANYFLLMIGKNAFAGKTEHA
jgi:hypothetical protein